MKSLPTASFVKNINDDRWTKNYTFYDKRGRAIGSHSTNHLGGSTVIHSRLDFTGTVYKTKTYNKRIYAELPVVVEEKFEYDDQKKLVKHYHQVLGKTPQELLAENTYNELGQLTQKKVGNSLQTIDYNYNIRGWMTGINLLNGALSTNKLFSYKINYENPTNPALKKFNGNISEIDWWTSPSATSNRYDYSYDGLNRLKKADFKTIGASGTTDSRLFNEELVYDANGNITNLKRNGKTSASSTAGTLVDNLNYTYIGNRVTNISDDTSNPTGYKGTGQLITYDLNGNMKTFPDKGITQPIAYNFLNLPQNIIQNSNSTNYIYRADGTKVSKAFTLKGTTINTDYLDGFVYTSTYTQQLQAALLEDDLPTREAATAGQEEALQLEQKVVVNDPPSVSAAKPSFFPTAEGFYDYDNLKYIYQYKDHLGNVRLSYSKNATTGLIAIEDTNDYYPFGLSFINGGASKYSPSTTYKNWKFGNKELQETGFYDYGARFYMPDIGRWGVVDKLSEFAQSWTPYRYAYNNPIKYYDPTGLIEEGGPDDPKKKEKLRTQNIEPVVITKYSPLTMKSAPPTFGDNLQTLRNSPPTAAYGAGNGMSILGKLATNIILDTGNALKNFIGIGRHQGGPAGEQWTRLDGFPMGGEEQQTQAVNMLLTLFGGQYGLAAKASAATKTPSFKSFSGTKKAWQSGATPNSVYTYLSADGETAVSNYIYNAEGKVSFQVDFQNHGIDWLSGHGHNMTIPGKLGSGHLPENHILHNLVPADFKTIPTNTTYSVPLAK